MTSVIWRSLGFVMNLSDKESCNILARETRSDMVGTFNGDQMKTLLFALALVILSGMTQAQSLARKYRHLFATTKV